MPRPSKIWYWKQRKCWYVTIDGVRHRLSKEKKEAVALFHQLMLGQPKKVQSGTVAALMDEFLEWTKSARSPRTYEWYQRHCQSFVDSVGNMSLSELTTYDIQKWITSAKCKDGTKNGMWRAINRSFNWAVQQELFDRNPATTVDKPGLPHRDDFITAEEYRKVLKHVKDQPFRDLVTVAWECGPRPQELLAVEARHFEADKKRWHFPPKEGKKKRRRIVYMTKNGMEITTRRAKEHPEGPIFRNMRGRPWTLFAINCRFQRLKPKIGRKVCLYLFRHAWITRKMVAGVDSSILKDLAGHVDAQMIDRVYGHAAENYKFMQEQAEIDCEDVSGNEPDDADDTEQG